VNCKVGMDAQAPTAPQTDSDGLGGQGRGGAAGPDASAARVVSVSTTFPGLVRTTRAQTEAEAFVANLAEESRSDARSS
jgi:hypothetical protein